MALNYCPYTNTSPPECQQLEVLKPILDAASEYQLTAEEVKKLVSQIRGIARNYALYLAILRIREALKADNIEIQEVEESADEVGEALKLLKERNLEEGTVIMRKGDDILLVKKDFTNYVVAERFKGIAKTYSSDEIMFIVLSEYAEWAWEQYVNILLEEPVIINVNGKVEVVRDPKDHLEKLVKRLLQRR